jgi:hypothetical protein
VTVANKAFYNRLARVGFATFMQQMLARLIAQLRLETLTPDGERAIARFTDLVIQDGTSFAVKPALAATFPGRFTTIEPAAVEVHATYSGRADDVSQVTIAPDAQAERPFLPTPAALQGRLLLADRGYPDVQYFAAVTAAGGAFIMRLTRTYDPEVRAAWVQGRRVRVAPGRRLAWVLARHAGQIIDADVEFVRGPRRVACAAPGAWRARRRAAGARALDAGSVPICRGPRSPQD